MLCHWNRPFMHIVFFNFLTLLTSCCCYSDEDELKFKEETRTTVDVFLLNNPKGQRSAWWPAVQQRKLLFLLNLTDHQPSNLLSGFNLTFDSFILSLFKLMDTCNLILYIFLFLQKKMCYILLLFKRRWLIFIRLLMYKGNTCTLFPSYSDIDH